LFAQGKTNDTWEIRKQSWQRQQLSQLKRTNICGEHVGLRNEMTLTRLWDFAGCTSGRNVNCQIYRNVLSIHHRERVYNSLCSSCFVFLRIE
jgi:hypothetical protein